MGRRGGAAVGRVRLTVVVAGVVWKNRRQTQTRRRRRLTHRLISPPSIHNRSLEYSHHEFRETGFSPILAGDLYCEEDGEDEEHCYLFDYDDEGNVIDEVRGSYIEI